MSRQRYLESLGVSPSDNCVEYMISVTGQFMSPITESAYRKWLKESTAMAGWERISSSTQPEPNEYSSWLVGTADASGLVLPESIHLYKACRWDDISTWATNATHFMRIPFTAPIDP